MKLPVNNTEPFHKNTSVFDFKQDLYNNSVMRNNCGLLYNFLHSL